MWEILIFFLCAIVSVGESVYVDLRAPRVIRAKDDVIKLKKLDISNNNLLEIQKKIFLQLGLLELQTIQLNNNLISNIELTSFSGLSQLEHLDLSHNNLTYIHPDTFLHNSNLSWLSLAGNKLFQPSQYIKIKAKYLVFLDLSNCNIAKITKQFLGGIEILSHLNLSHNSINMIERETFSHLKQLTKLDMSFNKLTSLSADIFPDNCQLCMPDACSLSSFQQSVELVVDGNPWKCDGLQNLFNWSRNKGLSLRFNCEGDSWDCLEHSNCSSTETTTFETELVDQVCQTNSTQVEDSENYHLGIIVGVIVTNNFIFIGVVGLIFWFLRKRSAFLLREDGTSEEENSRHEMHQINENTRINTE